MPQSALNTEAIPAAAPTVRFSVLGPLRAWVGDCEVALGPFKQRLVLATLLCRAGESVPPEALIEAVWERDPPRTARKNLQLYVCGLRRILDEAGAPDRLVLRPGGYLLRVTEDELDVLRLSALAQAGRDAAALGNVTLAARTLERARRLWGGPPLVELAASESVRAEADRLELRYAAVCEDWAEAALRAGWAAEVAEAGGDLIERHPLRERLRIAHMTALHRSGRRGEALAAYDELRRLLAQELGISPSPAVEAAYRVILADEGATSSATARRRSVPLNLPPETADFVGRAAATADLVEVAASSGGVILLVGQPGVGKTALALRVAHRLGDEFTGGRIFVRLREPDGSSRPAASVLAELLAATDEPEPTCSDLERDAARWRNWCADRRVLLVLDDAPNEAAVRPLLPGGRGCVIVTASSQLAGLSATRRLHVRPLPRSEALDMLASLIGAGRALSDPASAERIVASCGMLPLAIRAAGLKLAVLQHMPLAEYAARLAGPGTVLDNLTVGDLEVRARAAREWRSLRHTHKAMLRALATLSVSGRFTAGEAAAMAGAAPDQMRGELESMIEAGALISPGREAAALSAVYRLPYLTHLYVRESAV